MQFNTYLLGVPKQGDPEIIQKLGHFSWEKHGKTHWETKELRPGSAAPHLRAEAERLCGTRIMPW